MKPTTTTSMNTMETTTLTIRTTTRTVWLEHPSICATEHSFICHGSGEEKHCYRACHVFISAVSRCFHGRCHVHFDALATLMGRSGGGCHCSPLRTAVEDFFAVLVAHNGVLGGGLPYVSWAREARRFPTWTDPSRYFGAPQGSFPATNLVLLRGEPGKHGGGPLGAAWPIPGRPALDADTPGAEHAARGAPGCDLGGSDADHDGQGRNSRGSQHSSGGPSQHERVGGGAPRFLPTSPALAA